MPEGHTMHRLAQDLGRDLKGHQVGARSPQGRLTALAAELDGRSVVGTDAFGKNVRVRFGPRPQRGTTAGSKASGKSGRSAGPSDWADELGLRIHLGLIGKMKQVDADEPERDTIRLRLTKQVTGKGKAGKGKGAAATERATAWDLVAPQRCELVSETDWRAFTDTLGPDPLRRGSDQLERFAANLRRGAKPRRRSEPLAVALLDQKVVAGIGNVYRSELPFLLGVDPRTDAHRLDDGQIEQLWELARTQLRDGVRRGRIVTVTQVDGGKQPGRLQPDEALYAYKRAGEPCRRCATPITSENIDGRNIWWCPRCQA